MNSYTVGGRLFVEVPTPVAESAKLVRSSNHHVLVFDRSGSMYPHISGLVEDLKKFLTTRVPADDMVSIGWFSTEGGTCDFVLKCCDIGRKEQIVKALDKMASVIGMTCFSEILGQVPSVIETGEAFTDTASLMFFSDGYPVVSNTKREMEKVYEAISKIAPSIGNAVVVGYGQYYNRAVLAEMSEALGATFVHASRLTDFYAYLDSGYAEMGGAKRVQVNLPAPNPDVVFALDEDTTSVLSIAVGDDGSVKVPSTVSKVYAVYPPNSVQGAKETRMNLGAVYAAAALYLGYEETQEALELLSAIGDKHLVGLTAGAWTIDDFAKADAKIRKAAFRSEHRFIEGKHIGCLPDANAFCVLDALEILANDPKAMIDLGSFEYKKIGAPRKTKEGYPKFNRTSNLVPMAKIVFASDRMNVSMGVPIKGYINIGKNDVGLPEEYQCSQFRNFTFIRDGNLNVDSFNASMSQESLDALSIVGGVVPTSSEYSEDALYHVDLTKVPMISLKYAENNDGVRVARLRGKELALTAKQKVVGYYIEKMTEEEGYAEAEEGLTPEQQEFLNNLGVKKGIYSPPTVASEANDSYIAKTFDIKVKGWSSLPKIDEVLQKVKDGKKITGPSYHVAAYLEAYKQALSNYGTDDARYAYLLDERDLVRQELRTLRRELQGLKFAVCLMPGMWFSGVSRVDPVLVVDDVEYTFALGTKQVEY